MYVITFLLKRSLALVFLVFCFTINAQTTFQKSLGGTQEEYVYAIEQVSDGGYIMCGRTFSSTINGSWDAQIIRLNASGDTVWTKNYGNVGYDEFQSIKRTSDGGFIVCGQTDVVDALGDVLLMKIDANGAISWSKTYGASNKSDYGYSVRQTTDGGYIVAGSTKSVGTGLFDIVLIKTTSTGALTWSVSYGGTSDDIPRCVEQTADNGYIVAGYTTSYGSNAQMYLVKVGSTGASMWSKTIGGSNSEVAYDVKQLSDGSYAVAGYSDSYGAGNFDMMLVKLTSTGGVSWVRTYGGTSEDRALGLKITSDNGYILTGFTNSFGGGSSDYYLVKTDAGGALSWSKAFGGALEDRAYSVFQTADGGYITTGYANSYGQGMKESYVIKTNASGVSNCNEVSPATITNIPVISTNSGVSESTGITETSSAPTIVRRKSTIVIATQCFSAGVTCTVDAAFTSNPSGAICAGTTVNFTNTSTAATSYKWKVNGTQFATTTNASYTFNTAGSYTVRLVAIDGSCSDSTDITVTVNPTVTPSVSLSSNPASPICAGTNVTFTATPVNGGSTPTYVWYNGINPIPGATNATFTTNSLANGNCISVQMTSNAVCASSATTISNCITYTVNPTVTPSVSITSNPSGPICAGQCVTFTATPVNGGNAPFYQWRINGSNVGSNSNTYTTCNLNNGDAVSVVLTSNANCASPTTATSNTITMQVSNSVTPSVAITQNPSGPICAGQQVTFTATPTNGGTPTYTWYINNVAQPNSNSATFTGSTLANGDIVKVEMVSSLGCANPTTATSSTFTISITPAVVPSVTITASPAGPFCQDGCVTYTATPVNGGPAPSYQWNINGTPVQNQTNAAYNACTLTSGDVITATITSSAQCAIPTTVTSNSNTYSVYPVPAEPVITANGNVLTSSYATGNTWFMVGNPSALGNGQNYSITQSGDYYIVYAYGNGCTIISDTISVIYTGIDENTANTKVLIYPNPTQNNLTIETNIATAGRLQLDIKNMLGQSVYIYNDNAQPGLFIRTLELNATPGIYFLTLRTNAGITTHKIEIVK